MAKGTTKAHPIGRRLQELREARGLSALAVSHRAGLSVNYVRQLERGGRYPRPDKLAAVASALGLDEQTHAELRRLAGIDSNPASEPEARSARRNAWRPLLYILVNHVLLPRLDLAGILSGKRRLRDDDCDLIARAAAAPDIATFVDQVSACSSPGRGLHQIIEETFGSALPTDIRHLKDHIHTELFHRNPSWLGAERREPYRYDQRWAIASLLRGFNRPPQPESALYRALHTATFDYAFALSIFPLIYWHSCHAWPFEKLLLPYARRSAVVQRQLYDAVRSGLSLEDFDRVLLGAGELGAALIRQPPVRPSPDDQPGPGGPDSVTLILRTPDQTHQVSGRRPIVDAVFDHLDRCEFLERFPLLKVDRDGAAALARSVTLPSWTAWTEWFSQWKGFPPDQPPRGGDRFVSVLCTYHERDATEDDVDTLDSFTARQLTAEASEALARLLGRGRLDQAAQAAAALEIRPHWLAVVRAIAARRDAGGEEH